ncbi:MAG: ATP-binding protein [Desulfovibrionales bacterium]|nr:ATP-binding protein [Desulfovibrionales bacterium]
MSDILRLPASLESLVPLRKFMNRRAEEDGVPETPLRRIELVMEELVVNLVEHAYLEHTGDVEVTCGIEAVSDSTAKQYVIYIRDWSHPFNPLDAPDPDLDSDIEHRAIGGLGLHFVRMMSDECTYEREGDANIIRLAFNIPEA